ncbi:hypothetical protein [Nocardia rhizosphaerihabitans]|uniref:Uncharacterized protein n=1 Tax=Nocardia rhizosphaerihabitans TaxID=1691570 RepID=A0ABQ2KG01_9NOCA|nr:hypothetical protein [Nocardia rhizosphaerihabitans]GGN81109.1 hypothetical protein GCM10011610_31150 [Nocardia rhizosphaerihabitans]
MRALVVYESGLSRTSTRQDAAGRVETPVAVELGIREWLDAALPVSRPRRAAAFGTKMAADEGTSLR